MDFDFVYDKLLDWEGRSRRINLRIYVISESKYETWENCEKKDGEVFDEELGLENIHIERAHRVKRGKNDKTTKLRAKCATYFSLRKRNQFWKM